MFGRFLSLFPSEIASSIRSRNERLQDKALWVENTDNTFFNANLHPPLLKYEITLPASQNQLARKERLALEDMLVILDDKKQNLQLEHRETQQKISMFDFGFEATDNRSPLFQFLAAFSLAGVEHRSFNNLVNDNFQQTDDKGVILSLIHI